MSEKGFNPKDLEDICSRPRTKFKMKKSDYKELGRNVLLGSVDVAIGCLGATVLSVGAVGALQNGKRDARKFENNDLGYGYKDGDQGPGFYFGDIKSDK